jgi:formylglycine-generating enzyme
MSRTVTQTLALALPLVLFLATGSEARAVPRGDMVRIPAGSYQPLYGNPGDPRLPVRTFRIDRDAVTRGAFLAFVRTNVEWRRSRIKSVFAPGAGYLADWRGDLDAGDTGDLGRPVVNVSWFAARAFCAAEGKRLPTVTEWEYVAASSASARDASRDPAFIQQLVDLYATRAVPLLPVGRGIVNAYGVRGMHGLASEWVEDFNSVLVSDDSRGVGGRDHDFFCASAAIGAVDASNYPAFLRFALRSGLNGRSTMQSLGFRCAA